MDLNKNTKNILDNICAKLKISNLMFCQEIKRGVYSFTIWYSNELDNYIKVFMDRKKSKEIVIILYKTLQECY